MSHVLDSSFGRRQQQQQQKKHGQLEQQIKTLNASREHLITEYALSTHRESILIKLLCVCGSSAIDLWNGWYIKIHFHDQIREKRAEQKKNYSHIKRRKLFKLAPQIFLLTVICVWWLLKKFFVKNPSELLSWSEARDPTSYGLPTINQDFNEYRLKRKPHLYSRQKTKTNRQSNNRNQNKNKLSNSVSSNGTCAFGENLCKSFKDNPNKKQSMKSK